MEARASEASPSGERSEPPRRPQGAARVPKGRTPRHQTRKSNHTRFAFFPDLGGQTLHRHVREANTAHCDRPSPEKRSEHGCERSDPGRPRRSRGRNDPAESEGEATAEQSAAQPEGRSEDVWRSERSSRSGRSERSVRGCCCSVRSDDPSERVATATRQTDTVREANTAPHRPGAFAPSEPDRRGAPPKHARCCCCCCEGGWRLLSASEESPGDASPVVIDACSLGGGRSAQLIEASHVLLCLALT